MRQIDLSKELIESSSTRLETVLLPGTYDPVTLGHLDVIARSKRLADNVVVGVAPSLTKRGVGTIFSLEDRVRLIRENVEHLKNVSVMPMEGLMVEFAKSVGAGAIVKGMRSLTDFEYEFQQAHVNYNLEPDIETIFIMSHPEYSYMSSSMARELASYGGDVSDFVPENVEAALKKYYNQVK